jgi:hypothetical protein
MTTETPIRHYKKVDAAWIRKMHEGLKALGYTYKNGVQQMLGSIPEWIALHSDGTVSAKWYRGLPRTDEVESPVFLKLVHFPYEFRVDCFLLTDWGCHVLFIFLPHSGSCLTAGSFCATIAHACRDSVGVPQADAGSSRAPPGAFLLFVCGANSRKQCFQRLLCNWIEALRNCLLNPRHGGRDDLSG